MNNKLKPLGRRVLLEAHDNSTVNGIYLAPDSTKPINKATVVEVGTSKEIEVKVGDIVLYHSNYTTKLEDGTLLIDSSNILGRYRDIDEEQLKIGFPESC